LPAAWKSQPYFFRHHLTDISRCLEMLGVDDQERL
jgi:hypothetical protein